MAEPEEDSRSWNGYFVKYTNPKAINYETPHLGKGISREPGNITLGEMYKVIKDEGLLIRIINDEGEETPYFKKRFVKMGVRIWTLEETISEIRKEINGNA